MIVDSVSLAHELQRRRVGRPEMRRSLLGRPTSTWVPGDLRDMPTSLLVLAAMCLSRDPEPEL